MFFISNFKGDVNLVLEKLDSHKELNTHNRSYPHILFDSYNRFASETDDIYDYLPSSTSKAYTCTAKSLRNGKILAKTKLLIEAPNSVPHVIKYIFVDKSAKPIALHEYYIRHQSGLLYKLAFGIFDKLRCELTRLFVSLANFIF